jgi:prepilin-type N-terminal cleavage/methylation domain-containing protein
MMSIQRKTWITQDQRGVNLIELMAVVAIIAIVTAIAVPVYVNYLPFLKVRSATRDLISDLRYARQLAVTKNQDHRLIFRKVADCSPDSNDTNCYSIQQKRTQADWSDASMIKVVDLTANYADIARTSATTSVEFEPTGGTTSVGDVTFTLAHGGTGEIRNIKVSRFGRVWTE